MQIYTVMDWLKGVNQQIHLRYSDAVHTNPLPFPTELQGSAQLRGAMQPFRIFREIQPPNIFFELTSNLSVNPAVADKDLLELLEQKWQRDFLKDEFQMLMQLCQALLKLCEDKDKLLSQDKNLQRLCKKPPLPQFPSLGNPVKTVQFSKDSSKGNAKRPSSSLPKASNSCEPQSQAEQISRIEYLLTFSKQENNYLRNELILLTNILRNKTDQINSLHQIRRIQTKAEVQLRQKLTEMEQKAQSRLVIIEGSKQSLNSKESQEAKGTERLQGTEDIAKTSARLDTPVREAKQFPEVTNFSFSLVKSSQSQTNEEQKPSTTEVPKSSRRKLKEVVQHYEQTISNLKRQHHHLINTLRADHKKELAHAQLKQILATKTQTGLETYEDLVNKYGSLKEQLAAKVSEIERFHKTFRELKKQIEQKKHQGNLDKKEKKEAMVQVNLLVNTLFLQQDPHESLTLMFKITDLTNENRAFEAALAGKNEQVLNLKRTIDKQRLQLKQAIDKERAQRHKWDTLMEQISQIKK